MEHETQLVNMYQHYSCVSRQVDGGYIIRLKNGDGSGGGPEGGRHHIGLKDTSHLLKRRVKKKKKNLTSIQFNSMVLLLVLMIGPKNSHIPVSNSWFNWGPTHMG